MGERPTFMVRQENNGNIVAHDSILHGMGTLESMVLSGPTSMDQFHGGNANMLGECSLVKSALDAQKTKPTNPKDAIGDTKLGMSNVPDCVAAGAALAFLEGALKYGRFNWRIAGVRASVYHSALLRHLSKWWNGQDSDPDTGVHHLDSIIACVGILRDAGINKMLTDDRPPASQATVDMINNSQEAIAKLKELFKDKNPKQYTIHDSPD